MILKHVLNQSEPMKTKQLFLLARWVAASMAAVTLLIITQNSRGEAEQTEHFERTIVFPFAGTLQLGNFSGDVHITGTIGKDLVVKAVRRAKRDLLEHIALDIHTSDSTITINANKQD